MSTKVYHNEILSVTKIDFQNSQHYLNMLFLQNIASFLGHMQSFRNFDDFWDMSKLK